MKPPAPAGLISPGTRDDRRGRGPAGGRAPAGPHADDAVSSQVRRLLRGQRHTRHWPDEAIEDAAQEVEVLLLEWGLGPIRGRFTRENFHDPDYTRVRDAVFRAIQVVYERSRNRHKVEVKPTSVFYDPDKAASTPARRQRRELPADQPLGARDVADPRDGGPGGCELALDLDVALAGLARCERELVLGRVHLGEPWPALAARLGLTVPQARQSYLKAVGRLTSVLRAYDDAS